MHSTAGNLGDLVNLVMVAKLKSSHNVCMWIAAKTSCFTARQSYLLYGRY